MQRRSRRSRPFSSRRRWLPPALGRRPAVTGGNGTLYIGGRPNKICIIDEATEKVTGEIPFKTGDSRRTDAVADRKRFYLLNIAYRGRRDPRHRDAKTIDSFTLSEGNKKVRIRGLEPDPLNRFMILLDQDRDQADRPLRDRRADAHAVRPSEHKVVAHDPVAEQRGAARREHACSRPTASCSTSSATRRPDLRHHRLSQQVDKWELSQPLEEGFGTARFGSPRRCLTRARLLHAIFNVQDPVQNRRIMGVGRVNLAAKSVDFYPLGPATRGRASRWRRDRRGLRAAFEDIGHYEFWTFDLEHHKLGPRTEFRAGRAWR